ncbi:MAG: chloride channel protein [Acidimicrobiia bacterium]|nr:chloride channel protein [Acidimicrobiia bacterium]
MRRRDQIKAIGRQYRQSVFLAAAVGALTGLVVAFYDELVVEHMLKAVLEAPLWVAAFMPLVGLLVAAIIVQWVGGSSTETADAYIRSFHDPNRDLDHRPLLGRLAASVATLGSGGAMGLEGPSVYIGAGIGSQFQRRFARLFTFDHPKLLMVAGAAAGVAAIFKTPATGAIFALEVPYQGDLARRMLLPALVAAASGYLVFVSIEGTDRLLPVTGAPDIFDLRDLGGAIVVGVGAGLLARGFAKLIREAKALAQRTHPYLRALVGGLLLAGLFGICRAAIGESLTLGPGFDAVEWALDPSRGVGVLLALFMLRAVATSATVAGGGAGGLFVPLVVAGALFGRAVGGIIGAVDTTLFLVIGVAAFLGAGYRVPLAAVMFVAESTGRPGFVVPGVIAAVAAELVMGRSSVSVYQVAASDEPEEPAQ